MTEAVLLPGGVLRFIGRNYRAAIGAAGISADKRESDMATPAALMPLRRILFRADRMTKPRAAVPIEPIAPDDGWCDDPRHPDYNRRITLPHPARHEALWREDNLYDLIGVLGWNDAPAEPDRGSAIFLHVATADYPPTAGCIALSRDDLVAILAGGITAVRVEG